MPVARRGDKPDAIAWLVKHHPELSDAQISRLIGTTKDTITKIRERTHWNIANIQAKHPAMLGLCKQQDLNAAIEKAGGQPKQDAEQVLIYQNYRKGLAEGQTKGGVPPFFIRLRLFQPDL